MSATIVDGRELARGVLAGRALEGVRLGILTVGFDAAGDVFVRTKVRSAESVGVVVVRVDLPETSDTQEVSDALGALQERCDGVVVQLPLPAQVDTEKVFARIDSLKDADALSKNSLVLAPVAEAVAHILRTHHVAVGGVKAVVIGAGRLVGTPCAKLLIELGADVSVVDKGDSFEVLKEADLIVSGAGVPCFIKPEHIQEKVVLIDAGTSESAGKVVGDIDPACVAKAKLVTPVPGGVGPLAVAMLFKNLEELVRMQQNSQM